MKKSILALVIIVMSVFLFSGCFPFEQLEEAYNEGKTAITDEKTEYDNKETSEEKKKQPKEEEEESEEKPEASAESENNIPEEKEPVSAYTFLEFAEPMEFYFSSGAGGWGTELILSNDGSFTGEYHDSEMGSTGPGYPNGTCYISRFKGKFGKIVKVNDWSYSMVLESLTYERPPQSEWIENGILYIASDAYGLEDCNVFTFYMPSAPVSELNETFISWNFNRSEIMESGVLGTYGIRNTTHDHGIFN